MAESIKSKFSKRSNKPAEDQVQITVSEVEPCNTLEIDPQESVKIRDEVHLSIASDKYDQTSGYITVSSKSSRTPGGTSSSHLLTSNPITSEGGLNSEEIEGKLDEDVDFDNIDLNFARNIADTNSRLT